MNQYSWRHRCLSWWSSGLCDGPLAPIVIRNPIPLKVNAECVAGASPENGEGAILNCNQEGTWTVIPGAGCQCNPGFIAAENGTSCIGKIYMFS